jgi:hypothetical protein
MGPGIVEAVIAPLGYRRPGGEAEGAEGHRQDGEGAHLDVEGVDLLAQVFGRPPDHQAGDEDGEDDEDQHAVEAGSDAAEYHLAEMHVEERYQPAEWGEGVVHAIDRAAGGVGGYGGEERRAEDPEAHLLALHVAAGGVDAELGEMRIAGRLGRPEHHYPEQEQDRHRYPHRPAMGEVARLAPEVVGQAGGDEEDREHLHEVRQCGGVLEGVCGIGIEESATVGAEHLDRHLRGGRSLGERLGRRHGGAGGLLHAGGGGVGEEVVDHPLRHQEQRIDHADRRQQVEVDAHQVGPEVAHGGGAVAGDGAHQHRGDSDADRGREEVVGRQGGHLREVGHGRLAGIALPVGVGGEADRGVESEVGGGCAQALGIEREEILQAQDAIAHQHAHQGEQQERDAIILPALLLMRVDGEQAVAEAFEPAERQLQARASTRIEDLLQVQAHRLGEQGQDAGEQQELQPSRQGHGRNPRAAVERGCGRAGSEALGSDERPHQVDDQCSRDHAGDDIFHGHSFPHEMR